MNVPLFSKRFDIGILILPGIFASIFVIFGNFFNIFTDTINSFWWLILVVILDVGHVWSTLFRTYFHEKAILEFKKELILVPILAWSLGVVVYSIGNHYFWTCMVYLALFHFVKQQIGILKIYLRQKIGFWKRDFDIFALYTFVLVPICHWHLNAKEFSWFVPNDFFEFRIVGVEKILWIFYGLIGLVFIVKEWVLRRGINYYKNGHVFSTVMVWLVGIVFYNNDYSFSITNIIHHAIPYLGLIWISSFKGEYQSSICFLNKFLIKLKGMKIIFYFSLLIVIGYIEESLWDKVLWHEHQELFGSFFRFELSESLLTLIVPLLAMPQITHYVLDGYIWRKDRKVEGFQF